MTVAAQLKSINEMILELVWRTRCAGCEAPDTLLCVACEARLIAIERANACPQCGAPFGRIICTECQSAEGFEPHAFACAVSCVEMGELAGRIIVVYKDHDERRLSRELARHLATALPTTWLAWAEVLTWIPTDRKTLRRRGFDHMALLARELAPLVRVCALPLLRKHPTQDQRTLSRTERKLNLAEAFDLTVEEVPGNILLIDDVLTTGATLDAAAEQLLAGGAREVRVASFARVW